MDSTEEWVEKKIENIYKHPLFDKLLKAAYYDVAVLGKKNQTIYIVRVPDFSCNKVRRCLWNQKTLSE